MKILILSDLHLEATGEFKTNAKEFDAVILAGDIYSPGRRGVRWAQRSATFGCKPVMLVPGNHEYYLGEYHSELQEMREAARDSNVEILQQKCVTIGNVRFLGCTLWTDFSGSRADETVDCISGQLKEVARIYSEDFQYIKIARTRGGCLVNDVRQLDPEDSCQLHRGDLAWLTTMLAVPHNGPTVVITHHAPSFKSVLPKHLADPLTAGFATELPPDLFSVPDVWVHGHVHHSVNYKHGNCLILANPRGRRKRDSSFENPVFNTDLTLEI